MNIAKEIEALELELSQPVTMSMFAGAHHMALTLVDERRQVAEKLAALRAKVETEHSAADWVMVPRTMTDEMASAFIDGSGLVREAWKQAIDAAPAAPAAAVDAFTKAVKEARRVWMEENPAEEGRDHVTPFDEFLYLSAAPAAKHWHDLYRAECRLRQDAAAHYGQQILDLEAAAAPAAVADTHAFKNFHRSLCDRFGYLHDEIDWRRDQVSLEEHIAKFVTAPAAVVDEAMVKRALDAKPSPYGSCVRYLIRFVAAYTPEQIMRAALTAALSGKQGEQA